MLNSTGSIWKGIGIGSALTVAAVAILLWLSSQVRCCGGQWTYENIWFFSVFVIGVIQLVWMLPAGLLFLVKKQKRTFLGILVVSGIVFLVDAAFLLSAMHGGKLYF